MILDNEFTGDLRVENEVNSLQNAGHQVFVLCLNYGNKKNYEEFNGAKIVRFNLSKSIKNKLRFLNNTIFDIYSLLWSYKIISFAKASAIEVLHVHDLYMAKSAITANKKLKLTSVLDLHENYPATLESYSWTKTFLGKLLVNPNMWLKNEEFYFQKFSKIIVLSKQFQNVLSKRYPKIKKKLNVYPNYPNVKQLLDFPVDYKIIDKKSDFIIFYFGGIAERRGIFTLLDALKILVKKSDEFKVLLIGPVDTADSEKLDSYLSDNKIKNNIIYYKWKDIKHLPSYIEVSDICVSPLVKNDQHESGIANKVFQYMLFEKPLIVSNCLPQQKVVEEENCGLVFESENVHDLAEKINTIREDRDLGAMMGKNGKEAVLEKYNLDISKQNLIELYKTI